MNALVGASGRTYTPLPIDGSRGFPQSFPLLFAGRTYQFRLYVNVPAASLKDKTAVLDLPTAESFLVVQVEVESPAATRETQFLRKVVPDLEYEAENIALVFTRQRVAVRNLNGQGDFGSQVIGGIAPRWA
ncbi:MAG TPA: hypothetical protein VKD91_03220 [Pyrinomonadaceae bacterium]|nr:hypothetical protein [Pyrinomonadaceae bacterium]